MHFLLSVTEYHIFSSLEHPLIISQFLYIRILGPTELGHLLGGSPGWGQGGGQGCDSHLTLGSLFQAHWLLAGSISLQLWDRGPVFRWLSAPPRLLSVLTAWLLWGGPHRHWLLSSDQRVLPLWCFTFLKKLSRLGQAHLRWYTIWWSQSRLLNIPTGDIALCSQEETPGYWNA